MQSSKNTQPKNGRLRQDVEGRIWKGKTEIQKMVVEPWKAKECEVVE